MEGRRMAGSGQDFIITSSHSASGPAGQRSSAVRDFGLVPLARRGRRGSSVVKQMLTSMSSITKLPQAG